MNNSKNLGEKVSLIIQKSFRSLKSAKKSMEDEDYDFGTSRAYYAVFYGIQAMLFTKGMSFSKHSGVIGAFNENFIKTSVFPKEFSKYIDRLFRQRQKGDYVFDMEIDKDEACENYKIAEIVVRAISDYLVQMGLIKPLNFPHKEV